jgi:GGDEF domain-containing protein
VNICFFIRRGFNRKTNSKGGYNESGQIALTKLRDGLLEEMQRNNCPITFGVGVLTCTAPPLKADELVRMADELMYSVKFGGKNAIVYSNYTADTPIAR